MFKRSSFFFTIIVSICLQFTDLKIGPIKISELILLCMLGIYLPSVKKVPKIIFLFFLFFLLLTLKTIVQNQFTHFFIDINYLPLMKHPGFLSVSRFFEYLCCLFFTYITAIFFKRLPDNIRELRLREIIEVQLVIFCSLYAFYFVFCLLLHRSLTYDSLVVYNTKFGYADDGYRLKGFYVEGGPFGLFIAALYILYDHLKKKTILGVLLKCFILLIIILMAQSKSGMSLVLFWYGWKALTLIREKSIFIKICAATAIFFAVILGVFKMSEQYVDSLKEDNNIVSSVATAGDIDGNVAAGKIAAMVIIPNIVLDKWIYGIGLGNYPLVRNNPEYRLFMPELPKGLWDAHGFGGFVDLMIDGGLIFTLGFVLLILYLYRLVKKSNPDFNIMPYFIAYIGPMLLGVQMYFLYPWFILGFILANISINNEDRKNNSY